MQRLFFLFGLTLSLIASRAPLYADEPAAPPRTTPRVVFSATGDAPYRPEEETLLAKHLADLDPATEFLVHVGDIQSGAVGVGREEAYRNIATLLKKSRPPVFILLGDNEYNDCSNPAEALQFWNKHLLRLDRGWSHDIAVTQQTERAENFAFVRGGVLFLGINLVGGRVHDPAEWKRRLADDAAWTETNLRDRRAAVTSAVVLGHALPAPAHDPYFAVLNRAAAAFDKPVLYLHGDGHVWLHDRPFAARNILRVQVDAGGVAPPVKVTVTDDPREPFVFDRRKPPPPPAAPAGK